MILSHADVKRILVENPSKKAISKALKYRNDLMMHMYGLNMETYLSVIQGFEEPAMKALRVNYTKSNKALFKRISKPLEKIFSARGSSTYYNLPSDEQEKKAIMLLRNVSKGFNPKKWVENIWLPHYLDDPNGFVFMEIDNDGRVYPTYKSIADVYERELDGNRLEYIVFKLTTEEKKAAGLDGREAIYRVVDDAFDKYYKVKGQEVEEVAGQTYNNYFGYVPAILNSDLLDPVNEGLAISLFDEIIELADEYILKGSIKITHDFLHAFPKYWEIADDCETCGGTRKHKNKECPECNGSGKSLTVKVSKAKIIDVPEHGDKPIVPHVAGYVEPSEIYQNIARTDMQMLEDLMHYTLWRTDQTKRTPGLKSDGEHTKTATEIIEGQSPLHDRLHLISETAEKRIKFIIDSILVVKVKTDYEGSSVNLGRRYVSEGSDAIWKRYVDAKKEGATAALLDELYIEFLDSKYSTDPVSKDIMIKLMQVEPFRHHNIEQVKAMGIADKDVLMKIYYGEWLNEQKDGIIFSSTVTNLRKSLSKYVEDKSLQTEEVLVDEDS